MKYQINDHVVYHGKSWVVVSVFLDSNHVFVKDTGWTQIPLQPQYILEPWGQDNDFKSGPITVQEGVIVGKVSDEEQGTVWVTKT